MQSVLDIPGLEEFEVQQFLCWSHGQLFVLFGSQSGHAVTGLAGDSYSRAAGANNFPHLFQQYGGSVEIHFKNGFNGCLAGGNPRCIDEHGNIAVPLCFCNQMQDGVPGREIHL